MSFPWPQLKSGAAAGVRKGWSSFFWIIKIVLPVSFLVAVLQWLGWLGYLDVVFKPLMSLLHLPSQAALPIIVGGFASGYAALAILVAVPFTLAQLSLIVVFLTICHELIIEGVIQHRAGMHMVKIGVYRFVGAVLMVFLASFFFKDTQQEVTLPAALTAASPFLEMLKAWGLNALDLLLKIYIILTGVMLLLEIVKALNWMEKIVRLMRPLSGVLGISDRTVTLWVPTVIFGLYAGGAIIAQEKNMGYLSKEEIERLHVSVGINHSMIEDPAVFLALGVSGVWVWIPRLVTALLAVRVYQIGRWLRGKLAA